MLYSENRAGSFPVPKTPGRNFFRAIFIVFLFWALGCGPAAANGNENDENDEDHEEEEFLEEVSEGLGTVALWGFVVLNGVYYYSMGLRLVRGKRRRPPPPWLSRPVQWKAWIRKYHYWGNPGLIGIAFLHGWTSEDHNVLLWLGWGLMGVLAGSGWTMKRQGADRPGGRLSRLIHLQHSLAVLLVLLLWIGHALAD